MKKITRILSLILAVAMLMGTMSVEAFAASQSFTVFSGQKKVEGWYPAFLSTYQNPAKVSMQDFVKAAQNKYATIEVTYTGDAPISLLLQSYPTTGNHYTWVTYGDNTPSVSNGKKVASFSASGLLNAYTSKKHEDDGSYLKLDNLLNFGIGGEGNTIYSIIVKWDTNTKPGITFDLSERYQTIDGWGASYTWYGDWLIGNNKQEQAFDWIFKDAQFNILRFRDLNKVRGYGGGFEDTTYKAYKTYYDAAVKRGIDPIVMVTSWGQYTRELDFVELCKNDSQGYAYYTLAKDKNGNYMYDKLAEFCVQSVKYFLDAGIPVHYFSISNETELQRYGKDENGNLKDDPGFYFGPTEDKYHCAYWKAHVAIYKAFKKAFGDDAPKITGAEVMADTASLMKEYLDPLIKNAPESFDTIAHHLYGSANTPQSFSAVNELYGEDYTLWQTEWYNNNFLEHANVMINELNYENVSAYLYWNGVWIPDDANCLIEVAGDAGWVKSAYVKRRANHYVMMHFSKFIKQGYQRVDTALTGTNCNVTTFISPDETKLIAVILNNTSSTETLKLTLPGYKIKWGKIYRSTFNTIDPNKEEKENEYMKYVDYLRTYSIEVPGNTLTTLEMKIEPRTAANTASAK